jgi:lipopolysaccharide export system permease protein
MTLLDRYIIRQYLTNIAALVVILSFFVITIDASLQLSRYWSAAAEYTRQGEELAPFLTRLGWTIILVLDIWWPRLLGLFNFLMGLILIGAMGFTCSQLVRHRELVAVLTSGQSLFRVARPILLVALGITVLQALGQEYVMPRITPLLTREPREAGRYAMGSTRVPLTDDGMGRLIYADSFDADAGTMHNLHIWERDQRGHAVVRFSAPLAQWREGGWDLEEVTVVPLSPAAIENPPTAVTRIETDLDPTILKMRRYTRFRHNLSYSQTLEVLRRLDRLGVDSDDARQMRERLQRSALGRISAMISNLLTLAIAMAFFVTREPRSMVLQSLKSAPIVAIALAAGVVGAAVPLPGVPPAVAAFLPVMILTPVAIAVVTRVRT